MNENIKPHARPAAGNRVAGRCGAASVVGPKSAAVAADGGGALLQVCRRRRRCCCRSGVHDGHCDFFLCSLSFCFIVDMAFTEPNSILAVTWTRRGCAAGPSPAPPPPPPADDGP